MLSDLFEFKLIFVRELVPFEKWYQEAMPEKLGSSKGSNQKQTVLVNSAQYVIHCQCLG